MKTNLLFLLCTFFTLTFAQSTADFENFNLPSDSFLNGSDMQGGFTSGEAFFINEYDAQWDSWAGFSISTKTDISTPGYSNQYSSISGNGYNQSESYGVAYIRYASNDVSIQNLNPSSSHAFEGLWVNNSTYAYLSMLNGDAVAKKFGGASGNDPDYLKLIFKKYFNGQLSSETVEFYLADYRYSNNNQDYLVDEWTYIDLTSLGAADSLSVSLESSDNGQFGMNTPAYFCIDNVVTRDAPLGIEALNQNIGKIYPNPATDEFTVDMINTEWNELNIYNMNGQLVLHQNLVSTKEQVNISALKTGIYTIAIIDSKGNTTFSKILKN